jgi:DNA-binding MarR family transcriptional regulator
MIQDELALYTGYLVRQAYAHTLAVGQAAVPADRHPRDLTVLATLDEHGPLAQAELGRLLRINRSVMVKVVDVLEHDALVQRERDPADRRRYALRLTDQGLVMLETLRVGLAAGEATLTAPLTPDEHRRLKDLLRPIIPDVVSSLPESITGRTGYLIVRVHHRLREDADERLRGLGIEPRQFGLLSTIAAREPCSQQRVAGCLGVTGPAVVQSIDELDSGGLILRERNPADRREHLLRLTPLGRDRLTQARTVMDGIQQGLAGLLGPPQVAELNRLLTKLITGE